MIKLYKRLNERQAIVQENDDYYLVTQSRKYELAEFPEVLVFPCNSQGSVSEWLEVNGERDTTLDQYLPKLLSSERVNLYY